MNTTATDSIVPFSPTTVTEEEIKAVVEVLRSGWITLGPKTAAFESAFAEHIGAPAALALNSCTAGLHLALKVLGIGPGDEVITSTLTFAATVNVIEHLGATPVLVDVEEDTLNLSPHQVEKKITVNTKAILVVHFGGHPADMDALQTIARRHHLAVVEDAAHALPASYRGVNVGSGTNLTSFSFYATKNLTTAEGGMLTGDPELVDRARALSLHGMSRNAWNRYGEQGTWWYDVIAPGYKCNMTDIQAAMGLVQLGRLSAMQLRRREIFDTYNRAFSGLSALQLPALRPEVGHAHHLYVLRLRREYAAVSRDELIVGLREHGVCTSLHFIPMHAHSYYREKYGFQDHDFPVAWDSFQRMLSLPLTPGLSDEQVSRIINGVLQICARNVKLAG